MKESWEPFHASDEVLKEWAGGEDQTTAEVARAEIARRAEVGAEAIRQKAERAPRVEIPPFDPRTEVSADAKRIVLDLWLVVLIVPIALWIIYSMLSAMTHL